MGGHYKKQQRAEKSKVKLKGAKLPKGLNVTKTEFKVRKIQIRGQLKDSQYIDGQRQVNLKEILTRLKHHGATFRLEALRNLREAILTGHSSIAGQLQGIIQGISSLCLDIEREPRRESFHTLAKLLSTLSIEAVSPFFHIISSYLRCAMTHIHPALQEDSLLMLDVLLENVPQLVAEQSVKIFHDFLQMISRAHADGSDSNRTLAINMGQKQTTIKWRAKVLQRLHIMLKTHCELQQKRLTSDSKALNYQMHTFNAKTPQYYPLKRSYDVGDVPELFVLNAVNAPNALNEADVVSTITTYIDHLMPLLVDSWLEVRPHTSGSNNSMGAQLLLSNDAAITLKVVLDITDCLWRLIDIYESNSNTQQLSTWFKQKYADSFASNFLHVTAFPYQQSENKRPLNSLKKSKKANVSIGGQYCLPQNMSLTYLMCRFFGQRINKNTSKKFIILIEYLQTIVSSLKQHSMDHQATLLLALRTQLLQNGLLLLQFLPCQTRTLLDVTIDAFLQQQFSSKEQNSILILLCDIVQNKELLKSYGITKFDKFVSFLPQLLLRPTITLDILLSMSNLCKQQNRIFLQALAFRVTEVVDNILKIQVLGAVNVFEGKKHIMNLFYWIERPTNAEELCNKLKATVTDKRIVNYFSFILRRCE